MHGQKRVFIVDVDNTLIDTESIKADWKKHFGKDFSELYEKSKLSSGLLNIAKLARLLGVDKKFFYDTPFKKYFFPESLTSIRRLKKMGKVIVYSLGDKSYQPTKIKKSGIETLVGKKNVIISSDKKNGLTKLIRKLKRKGYRNIIIIDDKAEILEEAFRIDPQITTVWLRYGKYKDISPKIENSITFEGDSLEKVSSFLQLFFELSIKRNISNRQVKQLIEYTNEDNEVKKYTHDLERFENKDSYSLWAKTEKALYTLVDKKGNLFGLIWFRPKKVPHLKNYPFTFAIRIYGRARGKGLAKKFMEAAFDDFMESKIYKRFKNKGVWLETSADNIPAYKLYGHFGFKQITKPDEENKILMVYASPDVH